MTDYFAYNGENVVPVYKPGVPSYGQEGSEGNTGGRGPSVYYTSYTLSVDEERILCNQKITDNKLLSNNLDEDCYNEYMEGDLIIDSLGNIYRIELKNDSLMVPPVVEAKDATSLGGEIYTNFRCKVCTSFVKNSFYPASFDNPYYAPDNVGSYKLYHSQRTNEKVYGNWILFSLTESGQAENSMTFSFNLVLPNGEVLNKTSSSYSATMFVDNKYFYGCFNCGETTIAGDENIKRYFGKDIVSKLGSYTVNELINYNSYNDNDEKNIYAAILISYFIHKYCTAYVEVCNNITHKIYRYDLTEFTPWKGTVPSETETYIEPFITPVYWDVDDSSVKPSYPEPQTIETEETITYYRTFKNFIVHDARENGSDEEPEAEVITAASYNFIQDFFFLDKNALSLPEGFATPYNYMENNDDGRDMWSSYAYQGNVNDMTNNGTPLALWIANEVSEKASTIKVKFSNVTKFSLNIRFNSFRNANHVQTMPYTMIYIGYPNVELWQPGDENGNVELVDSIAHKRDEDNNIYDGSTGVYYIHKIVPYGLKLNDGTEPTSVADAGFSVVTIDLREFDIDLTEENWIEIGAMMFGENSNEEHRPSIFPMDNFNEGSADYRDCVFGPNASSHELDEKNRYSLGNVWPNVCYSFAEATDIDAATKAGTRLETPAEIQGNDRYYNGISNIHFDAGQSDATLYINNIEVIDNLETYEKDRREVEWIDYYAHGLKWDSSTYTVSKTERE